MKTTARLGMAFLLLGGAAAVACPDFGMAVKVDGGKDYAGLEVRALATGLTIKTPAGVLFTFRWKGTMEKGKWCFDKHEGGKSTNTCQTEGTVNEEIPLLAKNDDIVAVVRMYGTPTTLAGTKKTGALLAIVQNGKPDPKSITYQSPWIRAVYSVDLKPNTVTTNDVVELGRQLTKDGVTREQAAKDYALTHHLYVDYFNRPKGGFGPPGAIAGTLTVDKTEIPLAPIPREPAEKAEADIDGNHWEGDTNDKGCQTKVKKK